MRFDFLRFPEEVDPAHQGRRVASNADIHPDPKWKRPSAVLAAVASALNLADERTIA
jgi:hypothetical protein